MNAFKTYKLDAAQEHGHTLFGISFKLFLLVHKTCTGIFFFRKNTLRSLTWNFIHRVCI